MKITFKFQTICFYRIEGIAEDQVDAKGRPTKEILTADTSSVSDSDTLELEDGGFLLRLNAPSLDVEEYSYRDEITPLRAYPRSKWYYNNHLHLCRRKNS